MKAPDAVAWLSVTLALVSPATGGEPGYRFSRPFDVDHPGVVRIQLPLAVLARLSASGDDLFVLGPADNPLPLYRWQEPAPPPPGERALRPLSMETVAGGWLVTADTGGDARHRMLVIDLPGTGLAEGVRLEGSSDRSSWRLITQGSLFRLDRWGATEKTYLEYPPTSDRYVRLFWPETSGFPAWHSLRVLDWPDTREPTVVEDLSYTPYEGRPGAYRFTLPKRSEQGASLLLDVELAYPIQARLEIAREGYWHTVAETEMRTGNETSLGLPATAFGPPAILTLGAGAFPVPPLRGLRLRHRRTALVFNAIRAGRHLLCYGARPGAALPHAIGDLAVDAGEVLDATLGPETAAPPALVAALAPGAAMPRVRFSSRWTIAAPTAAAGSLVTVELPDQVYGVARTDLGDLRIAHRGRQVPFVLRSIPEGRVVTAVRHAVPRIAETPGRSEVTIDLTSGSLPLVALELTTGAALFARPVQVEAPRPAAPSDTPLALHWQRLAQAIWRCPGASAVPARLTLALRPVAAGPLRVSFTDGDNAPLPQVDVVVWRRAHRLVFPWPGDGPVELCAGAPELAGAHYDIDAIADELDDESGITASLTPSARATGDWMEGGPVLRWALLVVIAGAALLLLAILARTLGGPRHGLDPEA